MFPSIQNIFTRVGFDKRQKIGTHSRVDRLKLNVKTVVEMESLNVANANAL